MTTTTTDQFIHHPSFNQRILLEESGCIVHSCDSIFSTVDLKEQPVTALFPIVESLYLNLEQIQLGALPLRFPGVESISERLPGIYDFSFVRLQLKGQSYILWSIYDYTELYIELRKYQQQKNELDMYCEHLEQRFKDIQTPEDVLNDR
ncbi:MAG: hypothetical protein AAGG75_00265 [Bacteroidota bacterium]